MQTIVTTIRKLNTDTKILCHSFVPQLNISPKLLLGPVNIGIRILLSQLNIQAVLMKENFSDNFCFERDLYNVSLLMLCSSSA